MSKNEELETLFKEWKKEQKKRGNEINNVFSKDGFIDEKKYQNAKEKILFIFKEPNILDQINMENDDQRIFYNDFFNKLNYTENEKHELVILKDKILNKRPYYKFDNIPVKQKEKIARIAEYVINKNITDEYEKLSEALKQIAFMNLNKSGGNSTCDIEYFSKYCNDDIFYKYICTEIKIINPTIIFLIGGNSYKNKLKKNLENDIKEKLSNENIPIIVLPHTSSRGSDLTIKDEEIEILNDTFNTNFYYKDDLEEAKINNPKYKTDNSKLHMKNDRGVLKYLLKSIAAYEKYKKL